MMALFRHASSPTLRQWGHTFFSTSIRSSKCVVDHCATPLLKPQMLLYPCTTSAKLTTEPSAVESSVKENLKSGTLDISAKSPQPKNGDQSKDVFALFGTIRNQIEMLRCANKLDKIWNDRLFKKATDELHQVATSLTAPQLIDAVAILLPVCPNNDPFPLLSLENQVRWMMRRMTASQLIRIVQLHANGSTDLRRLVHDEALTALERRWVEIGSGQDLISLLHLVPSDATHFLERIDDRALELCEAMTAKELYRLTYILARMKRRTAPLLRALVHHLGRRTLDLGPVHLSNLAFALATLHIHDPILMAKITSTASDLSAAGSPAPDINVVSILSSLVQSYGLLRWHDGQLIDAAVACFLRNRQEVSAADWQRLLMTAAWIDYSPPKLTAESLEEALAGMKASPDQVAWLDAVWSCTVLGRLTPQLASSVLREDFVSALDKTVETPISPVFAKLLNINAVAVNSIANYTEPQLSKSFIDMASSRSPSRHHDKLFDSVVETLSQIAPAKQYLQTDMSTPYGHVIDVLMLLNDRAEPQPFPAQGTSLPAGVHRVVIQALNFADMTSGVVQPNGVNSLAARTLTAAGYKVVQIPYTEFDMSSPIVKRVQYLHTKLKEVVAMPTDPNKPPPPTQGTSANQLRSNMAARMPADNGKSTPAEAGPEKSSGKGTKKLQLSFAHGKASMNTSASKSTETSPKPTRPESVTVMPGKSTVPKIAQREQDPTTTKKLQSNETLKNIFAKDSTAKK